MCDHINLQYLCFQLPSCIVHVRYIHSFVIIVYCLFIDKPGSLRNKLFSKSKKKPKEKDSKPDKLKNSKGKGLLQHYDYIFDKNFNFRKHIFLLYLDVVHNFYVHWSANQYEVFFIEKWSFSVTSELSEELGDDIENGMYNFAPHSAEFTMSTREYAQVLHSSLDWRSYT